MHPLISFAIYKSFQMSEMIYKSVFHKVETTIILFFMTVILIFCFPFGMIIDYKNISIWRGKLEIIIVISIATTLTQFFAYMLIHHIIPMVLKIKKTWELEYEEIVYNGGKLKNKDE